MAEEVIPHFREPDGKPSWAKEDRLGPMTRTEYAATVGQPERRPLVRLDGRLVDAELAYATEEGIHGRGGGDGGPDGNGAAGKGAEEAASLEPDPKAP